MKQSFNFDLAKESGAKITKTENSIIVDFSEKGGRLDFFGKPWEIAGLDWKKARHFALDLKVHEDIALEIRYKLYNDHDEKEEMWIVMGIMPRIRTTVSLPLEALDSKKMHLPKTPGKAKTVIFGEKVDLGTITRFSIDINAYPQDMKVEIFDIYLTDEEPEHKMEEIKMVDSLGQYKLLDWPSKTGTEAEMVAYLNAEYNKYSKDLNYPGNWSRYGGTKELQFEATGYFRTQKHNGRWWMADPEGYAFISLGLDCCKPAEVGEITGLENLFDELPDPVKYKAAYDLDHFELVGKELSFGRLNLAKALGNNWHEKWAVITRNRLVDWRFNTIGNWSEKNFVERASLPYVWPLVDFPSTEKLIFRDFPDVFSPEYNENSAKFAQQLKKFEGDQYLIGYFLRNEPNWGFVDDLVIAEQALMYDKPTHCKDRLVDFLKQRYVTIEKLNASWKTSFESFARFDEPIKKATGFSKESEKDLLEFSKIMIAQYVSIPSIACKAVDPVHLNMGMRYGIISSETLYAGWENFDVYSMNCYKQDPSKVLNEVEKHVDRPIVIGEFHFGSLDSGMLATGLGAARTQRDRGLGYMHYYYDALKCKSFVGAHYFILNDQAVLGRVDGENYNIGLVDVCNKPYTDCVDVMREANETAYDIAMGKIDAPDVKVNWMPRVAY